MKADATIEGAAGAIFVMGLTYGIYILFFYTFQTVLVTTVCRWSGTGLVDFDFYEGLFLPDFCRRAGSKTKCCSTVRNLFKFQGRFSVFLQP